MSANGLGTLSVIYAVDEQQNPLPRKTMLCGGDKNSTGGGNYVFPSSLGLRQSIQNCITGEGGSQLLFLKRKKDWGRKFLPLHGCSKNFWQTLYLSDFESCLELSKVNMYTDDTHTTIASTDIAELMEIKECPLK